VAGSKQLSGPEKHEYRARARLSGILGLHTSAVKRQMKERARPPHLQLRTAVERHVDGALRVMVEGLARVVGTVFNLRRPLLMTRL
jgi:hypothetical protein